MKRGVISEGRLKRIQIVLNIFFRDKTLNQELLFDFEKAVKYILKAREITCLLPTNITAVLDQENISSNCVERKSLELKLKDYFIINYKSLNPK